MIKNTEHCLKGLSYYEITFNGSAMIEPDGYKGITHIIEHCMCEKIKTLEPIFKQNAISWNAFTSDNQMSFYIAGLANVIKKYRKQFTEFVLNYKIEKEVFERERNVIIAEYYQSFSDQNSAFFLNWMRKYYNYTSAIGLIDDIKSITYEKFIEYKNKFYSDPSYIGFSHPKKTKSLINDMNIKFNSIKEYSGFNKFKEYSKYPMEKCADFSSQRILMAVRELPFDKSCKELACTDYLMGILCEGLTSPLYKELREKLQGVYSLYSCKMILTNNRFVSFIIVNADATKYKVIMNKFQEMLNNIKQYITEDDFNIIVNSKSTSCLIKKLSSYANGSEFSEISKNKINILTNKKVTYQEFLDYINKTNSIKFNFYIDNNF